MQIEIERPQSKKMHPNVSLDSILDILENFPMAVVLKDVQNDYRFEIWNKKAEEVTGLKKEVVLGKTDYELFPFQEAEHFRERDRFTVTQKGVIDIYEETLTSANGLRWLQTRKLPVYNERGEACHILVIFDDITERRTQMLEAQAARATKKAAEELKALAEAIPQMVWTANAQGKIDYRNSKWSENMKVDAQTGELDVSSLHPEDRSRFLQLWKQSLDQLTPFQTEYRLHTPLGYRWHLARAIPVKNKQEQVEKWFATSTEIHDQKKIEEELRIAQLRLKAILTSAPLVLFSTDKKGVFTDVDGSGLSRFGTDASRLVGKSAFRVYGDYPWFCEGLQKSLGEQFLVCEGDGLEGYFQVYFTPHYDEKAISRHFRLANDLTEYKTSERERTRLIAREESAIESSRLKSEFLANMSHEIRTPLNGLIGMAQAILETDLNSVQRECLKTLLESSDVLLHIINDILDISKIEAGKIEIKYRRVSLRHLASDLQSHFMHEAAKKSLMICYQIESNVPNVIVTDGFRLKQVLLNLVGNAVKFTSSGEIRIHVAQKPEGLLHFCVEDTGIGIAPEVQQTLFTPFTQGDATLTKNYGGTGLGLAISKHLIELLGGSIGLSSKPGEGSKFWFTIPVGYSDKTEVETTTILNDVGFENEISSPSMKKTNSEKAKILLVEDNDVNRMVISMFLSTTLAQLDFASNGCEAFEAFEKNDYDLVLMDCQMPVMNGYEATRKIRELEKMQGRLRTPIVGITANAMSDDKEKCLSSGMDDYLTKPIRRKFFLETLGKWRRLEEPHSIRSGQ